MKMTSWWISLFILLLGAGPTWATDNLPGEPGQKRFVERPPDNDRMPHAHPHVLPQVGSDPDDIYWDNSMSWSLPGVDGYVSALVVYDSRLVAAGFFTIAGHTAAMNIAAWDGTSWSPLGAGTDGHVYALTVYDNKLIAGGRFATAGGESASNVAAWDGTSWSALGDGTVGRVEALTVYDNKLIAGGRFSTAGGISAGHIAAWDGASWSALGTGMNTWVQVLTVCNNKLVAGGLFANAGGVAANHIASWDGESWSPLGTGMDRPVNALSVYDNQLIAAGTFSNAGGVAVRRIAAWDGSAWSPLGDGIGGPDFTNTGTRVRAVATYDNKLVAAGRFSTAGNVSASSVAAWDGASWSALGTGTGGQVDALAVHDNKLIAGGGFVVSDGTVASRIAAWDATAWSALGTGGGLGGPVVLALTAYGDQLIAAGLFGIAGEALANLIASWNGSAWSALGTGIAGGEVGFEPEAVAVAALTVYRGRLIAGGNFTGAGETGANAIAAWDGSAWSELGSGVSNPNPRSTPAVVNALTVYGDALIVGGSFEVAGKSPIDNIAAWDGASWSDLGSGVTGEVFAVTAYDDKLIAGGAFPTAGGVTVNGIAAWDGTSWSALGTGVDEPVMALAVYNHSLIAGGHFRTAGGVAADRIAAWDGSAWSPLGTVVDHSVQALAVHDNKLIAGGGGFAPPGAEVANAIAAWDGASWSRLGSGLQSLSSLTPRVMALAQYDGSLIAGGHFAIAGGKVALRVAEWTRRENRDVAVDVRPGSCPNPINGNSARGQGKAVLPAAILGASDFDVHDIDPSTVTLNGVAPVRWRYEDVGAPAGAADDDCACTEKGPDGNDDLALQFHSADIVATLSADDAVSAAGGPPHESYVVRVEGRLRNGSSFEGSDCVMHVGNPPGRTASETDPVRGFELTGNHPNPFNPQTTISFYLPVAVHVRLDVYDVRGRRVATLIDRRLETGDHSVMWNASRAASGIYYYRLQAGEQYAQATMLLLK